MSNYAGKTDIKNISHIDTSSFALNSNLASLKREVDKLDINNLVPVSVDLIKLSDVVKNDVVKKTVYEKLVAKVNNIDTSLFVLKIKYDTDKSELEKKIPGTSGLVKKTYYNAKITEIEGKIPSISGLATNTALTAVENKVPNIGSLVKKIDYDVKTTEIADHNHDKYITTPEFNELILKNFIARLAQTNLVTKTEVLIEKFLQINQHIQHLLVEKELKKLNTFDSIYFRGKSHFEEDGMRNYLVFQNILKELLMLVMIITFIIKNLKGYLMKQLILLKHLIIELLHT